MAYKKNNSLNTNVAGDFAEIRSPRIRLLAFFSRNLFSFILAFFIAVVIWLSVSFNIFPDVHKSINGIPVAAPVATESMNADNLKITEIITKSVNAEIIGKRYDIGGITGEKLSAVLDLETVNSAGIKVVPAKILVLDETKSIDFIVETPVTVEIKVVHVSSKTFDIIPETNKISASSGYKVSSVEAIPSTVTISGDEVFINSIKKVTLSPSDSTRKLSETSELISDLKLFGAADAVLETPSDVIYNAQYFSLRANVSRELKTENFQLKFDISAPGGLSNFDKYWLLGRMQITPSEISISAPEEYLAGYSPDFGMISLSEMTYGKLFAGFDKAIELPEGYISDVDSVRISFKDTDDYTRLPVTITKENVLITSNPANYEASLVSLKNSTVYLVGPAKEVAAITPDLITLTVNLSGGNYEEGQYDVNTSYRIAAENLHCWIESPPQVKVNITPINNNTNSE